MLWLVSCGVQVLPVMPTVVPVLLEALSGLEDARLNYVEQVCTGTCCCSGGLCCACQQWQHVTLQDKMVPEGHLTQGAHGKGLSEVHLRGQGCHLPFSMTRAPDSLWFLWCLCGKAAASSCIGLYESVSVSIMMTVMYTLCWGADHAVL